MKIDELSFDTIKREIKEEMNINLKDQKIKFITTLEHFFEFRRNKYHEIYFVYKYELDDDDYQIFSEVKENLDNHSTYYLFTDSSEFDKYNLLPLEIRDIIKE